MPPLLLAGFGLAFVLVVVRVSGVDVVPDSVGLALHAYGLSRVATGSPLLVAAAALAGVSGVVALVGLAPGALSESTETVVAATYNVTVSLTITLGATGLSRLPATSRASRGAQLRVVAACAALGVLAFVGGWAVNPTDHDAALLILAAGQAVTVIALVWYAVLLITAPNPGGTGEDDHASGRLPASPER